MRSIFYKFLLVSFVTILLFGFSSCKKDTTTTSADPSGTNIANLLIGADILLDDSVRAYESFTVNLGPTYYYTFENTVQLDLGGTLNLAPIFGTPTGNGYNYQLGCSTQIINLGPVNGIGSITTHPTSGYNSTTLAQVGSGYVVQVIDNNPDSSLVSNNPPVGVPRTLYYRVYVTTTVLNTSNGIAGYTIKYQGPF
jgi:hypothetical protein